MHGDCLELMKGIPDGSVDMVLTDPPYGTTNAPWDCKIDLAAMWAQLMRVLKPNGAACVFAQLPFGVDLINANRRYFRYEWIWQKTMALGYLNAHRMPMRAHENIMVFYRRLPSYRPQKSVCGGQKRNGRKKHGNGRCGEVYSKLGQHECYWEDDGTRYPTDIVKFNNQLNGIYDAQRLHPTQKPVDLLEYLIRTYTDEGETVLDCFMGSGSTGEACANTGRNFIGIELDDHYFDVASERIRNAESAAKAV